ncbi:TolC family protein [Reichenbachiella carrageenanivorans]|uniref:TolC family protein n=1 Tax=Reichenbachiella carrageenanivorans TaxID=2979869 RepID=A0ABY6D3Q6_9BACT|nr:TolC family protein [Reichenbachiella carrageenanivorans]UXX79693.1 TolC family protein [Reichenbachiella carrageenanivorans]
MKINKLIYIATGWLLIGTPLHAQEMLTKSDAVSIALENNFDIRAANNDLEISENSAKITNSGYLPNVSGSAGTNFSRTNSDLTLTDGSSTTINGAPSSDASASLNLDYTVFDGFGRMYDYKKLKENYNLSDLQSRAVMENTLVNLFVSYYEIARLSENELNQKQTLDISRERWLRAKYSFEFGQNSQLDILNAEVDYNTDSINYLTIVQQLKNEKRNLNLLMGRDVSITFDVDTLIIFEENLDYEVLNALAMEKNATLNIEQGLLRNSHYDIKVASSSMIPKIGLNSSYGWNKNKFAPGNFLSERQSTSLNIGASLTWNIFDGGLSNTRRQNAKLAAENQLINVERTELDLERQMQNAWTVYQTALFVLQAEKKNLETNYRNFDRSKEQYGFGQITSIEFRQAQFNLLTANLNYNQAKYSAKIAELVLLQLSGTILEAQF